MSRSTARALRVALFALPLLAAAAYAWPQAIGSFTRAGEHTVRPRAAARRWIVDQRRIRQIAESARRRRRSGAPATEASDERRKGS